MGDVARDIRRLSEILKQVMRTAEEVKKLPPGWAQSRAVIILTSISDQVSELVKALQLREPGGEIKG
jgi:hypothetical protein